jgi:hypothetical protein
LCGAWLTHPAESPVRHVALPDWDFSRDRWLHSRMPVSASDDEFFGIVRRDRAMIMFKALGEFSDGKEVVRRTGPELQP